MSEAPKPKVFYNSACPVCKAGIDSQRADMQACGIDAEWIDVHGNPQVVEQLGASLEDVRERLYVKDESGKVRIGAYAFTELWSRTPGQRWLARLWRLPLLRPLGHWLYNVFARQLYRWNRRKGHW